MDSSVKKVVESNKSLGLSTPDQLKQWLQKTGRRYMVLDSCDLVDALVGAYGWPDGAVLIQEVVARYRDHRVKSGETDPVSGVVKGDALTVTELDRAIRQLIGDVTNLDPSWDLTKMPL